jgi:hypothetical protein
MGYKYTITIERWPFFGIKQEDAGPRVQVFEVRADHMDHATALANQLRDAIAASPQVWQAPITKIELVRPLQ